MTGSVGREISMMKVVEQIRAFNAGREPERLALKYAKMRSDPFVFL